MKSPKDYVEEYQIDDTLFDRHERPIYLQGFITRVQKDAYNQAIEDAIRNCEILRCPWDKVNDGGINPDSILRLKIK